MTDRRSGYAPYEPLNILKPVADDIWIVDGPLIDFKLAGLEQPFPTRMTIIRLPGGELWVHSPTQADESLTAAIKTLGPVRYLIAPCVLHYWWIPDWLALFPQAEVYAVPGLPLKAKRPFAVSQTLTAEAPAVWASVLDQTLVESAVFTEADFFHRPSKTLILTDLIEILNPPASPHGDGDSLPGWRAGPRRQGSVGYEARALVDRRSRAASGRAHD